MNTYIKHKNLIPYLLELGWMIAKDTWTDCPQKEYDKLAKLSVDDLELVCMEYHNEDPVFHAHLKHMESQGEFFSKYKAKTNKPK